jgi:hypothetical protein
MDKLELRNEQLFKEVCSPAVYVCLNELLTCPFYVRKRHSPKKSFIVNAVLRLILELNANVRQLQIVGIVNCTKQELKRKGASARKEKAPGFLRGLF